MRSSTVTIYLRVRHFTMLCCPTIASIIIAITGTFQGPESQSENEAEPREDLGREARDARALPETFLGGGSLRNVMGGGWELENLRAELETS